MRNQRALGRPCGAAGVDQHGPFIGFGLHCREAALLRRKGAGEVHIHRQHVGGAAQIDADHLAQAGALGPHRQHVADR